MGTVYIDTTIVGTFSPDTVGTSGDVYIDTIDVGDFTLALAGDVYIDTTDVGNYTAIPVVPPQPVQDARYRTKVYLEAYFDNTKLTKDNNTTEVVYAAMYAYPNYPLTQEYFATSNAVDLLFLIDEPNSTPTIDFDQTAYGYTEHVPVIIAAVDKTGITATKLKWKAEAELRRIAETYPTGSLRGMQRRGDRDMRVGSTIIYMTEWVLEYWRDTT